MDDLAWPFPLAPSGMPFNTISVFFLEKELITLTLLPLLCSAVRNRSCYYSCFNRSIWVSSWLAKFTTKSKFSELNMAGDKAVAASGELRKSPNVEQADVSFADVNDCWTRKGQPLPNLHVLQCCYCFYLIILESFQSSDRNDSLAWVHSWADRFVRKTNGQISGRSCGEGNFFTPWGFFFLFVTASRCVPQSIGMIHSVTRDDRNNKTQKITKARIHYWYMYKCSIIGC